MKKKRLSILLVVSAFFLAIVLYISLNQPVKQSLLSFPEDDTLYFKKAKTTLTAFKGTENGKYVVKWKVSSITNKPAYLRQDVSLLYEDGRLISILNEWESNEEQLNQQKKIESNDSGHFEAITIHHAESHYQNETIKGKEQMSYDHLYVMASPLSDFHSFRIPETHSELEWYHVLDHTAEQELHYILEQAYYKYHLNKNDYYIFPLSYLHVYNDNPLPGMTSMKSRQVISRLWEGLYKNYIMGIKEPPNGQVESPIGSSMPYILLEKSGKNLYVITTNKEGHLILLKQQIPF